MTGSPAATSPSPAAQPAPTPRADWRRAGGALRRLVRDSSRTEEVFELIEALAGRSASRPWERFRADPAGQALLARRPDLLPALADRERLRALPEGTLGRAYAAFMDAHGLTPDALLEASEGGALAPQELRDADRVWFQRRLRDAHDLWHVLTGYGMDEAGEVALLAFTYARLRNRGIGVIVLAAAGIGLVSGAGLGWIAYLWRAYRRGRCARGLETAPFEAWLHRPLAGVREDLGIAPPRVAHPGGIVVANRGEEARLVEEAA